VAVADSWQAGAEGLGRTCDEVTSPFAGGPERAVGVGGFASFGGDEMQCADAERGGLLEDFPRGLRAGQADQECERRLWWRKFAPGKSEGEKLERDVDESGFSTRPVDEAGVEGITFLATQDIEDVGGARVGAWEGRGDFFGLEEDDVHDWRYGR